MHLRNLRRSWLLQWCEWQRWCEAVRGCSLLGAFPEELPLQDQCCSPQEMQSCSSCGLLILFPSSWQHKPLYLLQREIANCTGKEKINIVYALGQLCQCSLLCWRMLSLWGSAAPRPTVCNLAAGIFFRFICSKPPWKWQHPGHSSQASSTVLSTWFIVALWQSNTERIENKGGALPGLFKLAMMF